MLWGITIRFQKLSLSQRQVAHVLLTRPPLRILIKNQNSPFDLHVLSVPPAFVLSQDQTLYYSCISRIFRFVEINPVHNACVITSCVLFSVCTWLLVSFKSSSKGISRVVTFSCIVRFSRCCAVYSLCITSSLLASGLHAILSSSTLFASHWLFISLWQLLNYITASSICQPLFEKFFQIFFAAPLHLSELQLLHYITLSFLCQALFWNFFQFPSLRFPALYL